MKINGLFGATLPGLEKAMDLTWRRNEALSSNITNSETPGYRAVDVNFAGELERAFNQENTSLAKTDAQHLDVSQNSGTAHLEGDLSGATKPDGNNVDIDIQMGRLAMNSGRFTAATQLIRKKLGMIKLAIREGRS